ncbi:MTAP family purine nucleoside phosphorylase [Pelagicoccus sp. SDUM812005]|uniref:MTAP family purine nucleoside phosphorylase n=1 Tax=Pelagicoccus sp. SDUM812005 TaxID=3041257 RepID=UPI00280E00D0|nr:MTAP family purine nucleoside phosphorylase [Pelagicoccus sp. SDUM812005]MDQ8180118.1 MTAP family purine nucleoside phosphorylase [Pelagicoccus sp. SDUM812005]
MKIAIISGTSIERADTFADWEDCKVETEHGEVHVKTRGQLVAMNRHGFEHALPPHAINYRANVEALCQLGVQSVVTLSSVGSVSEDIPPGSLVSCEDYMSFAPRTFIDDRMSAFAPVIGNPHLEAIRGRSSLAILTGKVYMQTPGPRFETRAEVRAIRTLGGDVVGMTFANEADLILERGLVLTAFCMVDNFAHGVKSSELSMEAFRNLVAENQATINQFLTELVDYLEDCS